MSVIAMAAVQGYLEYCAHNAISVTTASARAYMGEVERRGLARQHELWKNGLNRGHTAPCAEDTLPPDAEIRQWILEYLKNYGYDTSSLQ